MFYDDLQSQMASGQLVKTQVTKWQINQNRIQWKSICQYADRWAKYSITEEQALADWTK